MQRTAYFDTQEEICWKKLGYEVGPAAKECFFPGDAEKETTGDEAKIFKEARLLSGRNVVKGMRNGFCIKYNFLIMKLNWSKSSRLKRYSSLEKFIDALEEVMNLGQMDICENHECSNTETRFCYNPDAEVVSYANKHEKNPIKAWGLVEFVSNEIDDAEENRSSIDKNNGMECMKRGVPVHHT